MTLHFIFVGTIKSVCVFIQANFRVLLMPQQTAGGAALIRLTKLLSACH